MRALFAGLIGLALTCGVQADDRYKSDQKIKSKTEDGSFKARETVHRHKDGTTQTRNSAKVKTDDGMYQSKSKTTVKPDGDVKYQSKTKQKER